RFVLRIERSQLDRASLHRGDALDDMALIRQAGDDEVVDTRCGIELYQNHFPWSEYRSHAVTGDAQRDVAPGGNIIRQLQPPITGFVPQLSAAACGNSKVENCRAVLAARRWHCATILDLAVAAGGGRELWDDP